MLGVLSMTVLTACSSDDGPSMPDNGSPVAPDKEEDADYVWMSFDISNAGFPQSKAAASRASDDLGHIEEAGSVEENYIDCDNGDFTLLLFDDNSQFIKYLDKTDYEIRRVESVSDYTKYTLRAKVHTDYFDYAKGNQVQFSLLIVANLAGVTSSYDPFKGIPFLSYFNDISRQLQSFEYTTSGTSSWMPSLTRKRYIPMSGIRKFSISLDNLMASNSATPCQLGTIDMQRAMVKLRFLDNVDASTGKKIKNILITGVNMHGSFIPSCDSAPNWVNATCPVEKASVSSDWYDANRYAPGIQGRYTDPDSKIEFKSFTMYVTEYSDDAIPAGLTPSRITITLNDIATNTDTNYVLTLSDLGLNQLSRNHIYEFLVKYKPEDPTKLYLEFTVDNWVMAPDVNIGFN